MVIMDRAREYEQIIFVLTCVVSNIKQVSFKRGLRGGVKREEVFDRKSFEIKLLELEIFYFFKTSRVDLKVYQD